MSRSNFTIVEMTVSCILVLILLCVLQTLPGCGISSERKMARQMQNATQIRGIQLGCAMFAQGSKDFYPGLNSNGNEATTPLTASNSTFGTTSTSGYDPAYRYTILLLGNFFIPEYIVSPLTDTDPKTPIATGGNLTTDNFSYAMLRIDGDKNKPRAGNWRLTNNALAPVIADRNIGTGNNRPGVASIHDSEVWRGSVAFNDNHVEFMWDNVFSTKYGNNLLSVDNLFADDLDANGQPEGDAAMVYQDATTYVNQK